MELEKDNRDKYQIELNSKIQNTARLKDSGFILTGEWKKFVREEKGFLVYAVDGEWIRNNLSVIFGQGGHGYVHEFIPLDEIWISTHHRNRSSVSKEYFNSTVIHEIKEYKEMKKGRSFWEAHQIALEEERKAGILEDPDEDPFAKFD